ncbi:hypothetical protein J2X61_006714 [Bacillus sp. 3255]|nr:hypothetical protein [Bacillus sp. 3255]
MSRNRKDLRIMPMDVCHPSLLGYWEIQGLGIQSKLVYEGLLPMVRSMAKNRRSLLLSFFPWHGKLK